MEYLDTAVQWIGRSSWEAGLIVILVLIVRFVFFDKIAPGWRYALWLLVLIRLLLPSAPESKFSIFNVAGWRVMTEYVAHHFPEPFRKQISESPNDSGKEMAAPSPLKKGSDQFADHEAPLAFVGTGDWTHKSEMTMEPVRRTIHRWGIWLFLAWLTGATLLGTWFILSSYAFTRRLRHHRVVKDPKILEILEECRRSVGVKRPLTIIETPHVESPALFGCVRMRLLLPRSMAQSFSASELRHIFLHELAHIRRHDVWVNWITIGLQIVHWFNPLLWYGFHRMRSDRELASDALALGCAEDGENKAYGQTILKLAEAFEEPKRLSGAVGFLEDRNEMRRRIQLIARFPRLTHRPALTAVLMIVLALISLTDARTAADKDTDLKAEVVTKAGGTSPASPTADAEAAISLYPNFTHLIPFLD